VAAADATIGERLKLLPLRIAARGGAILVGGGFVEVDDVPT